MGGFQSLIMRFLPIDKHHLLSSLPGSPVPRRNVVRREDINRKVRVFLTFLAGQGSAQALNLLTGFVVLRWLDIGSYAKYGLTYGFQSTTNILIDLGFSATIVALVGHRVGDRLVIGKYVRAGRQFRLRLLAAVMPVAGICFLVMTRRLHWATASRIGLLLSIFVSIYFSGLEGYYGSALIVTRRLGIYYRIQVCVSLARLAGCSILHFTGNFSAVSAVWINAAGMVGSGLAYKKTSRQIMDEPLCGSPAIERQMLRYVMPNIPGAIFYALQGQIALFLIAIVGQNKGVAQVSALGRIGQLFVLMNAFTGMVLEPWFARSTDNQVLPRYFAALGTGLCFSILLVGLSVACPGCFLWALGRNYQRLNAELAWTILSGCVSYLTALTWIAISARRLIYWSSTFLNIALILVAQVAFIVLAGVPTTLRAVQFGFVSALASLIAQCINLTYGLKRGPRVQLAVDETDDRVAVTADALIS